MKKQILLLSSALVAHAVSAQAFPGAIQQSIDQSLSQLPSRSAKIKPLANVDVLEIEKNESIEKLLGVEVKGNHFSKEVQEYWKKSINGPVSSEEIQEFNGWLFSEARRSGYLSYSKTNINKLTNGQVLEVTVVQLKINAIRLVSPEPELVRKYGDLVLMRLQKDFVSGASLDTLGLDQRLDSAAYDLPIELDATIRAVNQEQIALVVNLNPAPHEPWKLLEGVAQLNNYGLKAYGTPQILGSVTLRGHEPKASLSLTGQKSEGVAYGRAEYETAWYGTTHRLRSWVAGSESRNILGGQAASKGHAVELGVGTASIFDGYRDFVFKEYLDAVVRHSNSGLQSTGVTTSRIHDQQVRMRTVVDNEKLTIDASRIDYGFTMGHYSLLDGISAVEQGAYAKIELGLKHQVSWGLERSIYSVLRFRSQLTSGRLDTYNQFALGGISGVRAYTTADGVGDNGFQISAELNKRLSNGMTVGGFYDGGIVKLNNPQSIEYRQSYSLQALGAQLSGNYMNSIFNMSIAKGVGGYKGWAGSAYNMESKPNNWRLNFALAYLY